MDAVFAIVHIAEAVALPTTQCTRSIKNWFWVYYKKISMITWSKTYCDCQSNVALFYFIQTPSCKEANLTAES